jgi:hypothetical protein
MVLPMEATHASYALPVLRHLAASFAQVTFLTFGKRLFPDLNEDTALLLAEGRGKHHAEFRVRDLPHAGVLGRLLDSRYRTGAVARRMDTEAVTAGKERILEYLLPSKARGLYRGLAASQSTQSLGQIATVGIGYVTGANDFFHLTGAEAALRDIPPDLLRPAVTTGRLLRGLRFTDEDWRQQSCGATYLLDLGTNHALPDAVLQYLAEGEKRGVSHAYKCRTRNPWFVVPHVYQPDALLCYMGGTSQRLVANEAGVVAPNSLHVIRLHADAGLSSRHLAALWQTSLTRLSCELEGHALGGGMLKLEPREAGKVRLAAWSAAAHSSQRLERLNRELDFLVRSGDQAAAEALANQVILRDALGLTNAECELLRTAADTLCARRHVRGSGT